MIKIRRTNGQLQEIDTSTLEKYGYIIELMLKYPKLYALMHEDYFTNGVKSGWSLSKVVLLDYVHLFIFCIDKFF